jgi:ABC-type branched-subunit amino acid transport system substrate-binding protein
MNHSRRHVLARGASISLALTVPAVTVSQPQPAGRVGPVIHFVPSAGAKQDAARDFFAGAKLHFDDLNRRGGARGRRITQAPVTVPDEPAAQWREVNAVVARERPSVILGLPGDALLDRALAESPEWMQQTVIMSPLSGLPVGLDGRAAGVVTTRASYAEEAAALLRHFVGLGVQRIAMLLPLASPTLLRDALRRAVRDAGASGVGMLSYRDTTIDLPAQLDAAVRAQMQVVIMVCDTVDLIEAERRLRRQPARPQLAGMSTVNHRVVVEVLGPAAAQGIVLTQVVPNPARGTLALTRDHARLLEQMFDEPPSHLTLEGFLAARVLTDAMNASRESGPTAWLEVLRNGRVREVGGLTVDLQRSGSRFVDLAVISHGGRLAG